ncbi:GHKL domain-containing protein [candidate division WOR-3 bacterium]|nr:GHKL domain-containing protein [candidate division WOR-3 bacterium]
MRELRISFFLLFLLFISVDIITTAHSIGLRNVLIGEIDNRLSEAAHELEKEIGMISDIIKIEKVYPLIIRYSLEWIEFFDSKGNLIRKTDIEANLIPEEFSDTSRFWGSRYGLFPIKNGYVLISASEEYLMGLRNLFRISIFLRLLIYPLFVGLGVFIFKTFSYPFKTVEEVTGKDKKEIEFTMATIKEMAKDYREKLRNLREREKEFRQKLFLSRLGENVTQILHEIRNSTGAILGFGKLVRDEEIRECVLEEASKLNRFSNHLLSLSSPLKLEKKKVGMIELISGVIKMVDHRKVDIETNIPKDFSLFVDRKLMSQALYNLIDNAIYACKDGGGVKIEVESAKEDIIIRITDTGKGMDEDTLNSLFELFFTKKDGGVGVGMALTKRIIEAHNGDIEVKSKLGEGTEVIVRIPKENNG